HLYFEEDEYGLHPLTDHPHYRRFFTGDFYREAFEEEAPFGSDEGSDTYSELATAMRGKKPISLEDFPRYVVEDLWEMWFRSPIPGRVAEHFERDFEDAKKANSALGDILLLQCDQVIVATALGAVRITGRVPLELVDLALAALERMELWYQRQDYDPMSTASQIRADLHAYRSWLLSTRAE
ncbi:MAG: hypothetical protein Q4C87_09745, partial [Actinomycetaceae bacterium]|nr:hypothetical protein [Actinomycetaceae bacterium]